MACCWPEMTHFKIANRNQPHNGVPFEHRQMTEVALRHQGHAFIHGVLRGHRTYRARHDLAHERVAGVVPFENSLARKSRSEKMPSSLASERTSSAPMSYQPSVRWPGKPTARARSRESSIGSCPSTPIRSVGNLHRVPLIQIFKSRRARLRQWRNSTSRFGNESI